MAGTAMGTRIARLVSIVVIAATAACGGGRSMPAAPSPAVAVSQGFGSIAPQSTGRCVFDGGAGCFSATGLRPSAAAAAGAPTAPSGLTATASGSTVTLSWLAPTGTDPATGYVI